MSINEYLKAKDEGKEKHVPGIEIKECASCGELAVTVQVGREIMHPSTVEHAIKTITLYGATKEKKLEQLAVFQLGDEHTVPRARAYVKKGQYVLVHAGFAIEVLNEKEAMETLDLFREMLSMEEK